MAGAAIGRSVWRFQQGHWQELKPGWHGAELSAIYALPSGKTYFGDREGKIGLLEAGSSEIRPVGKVASNALQGFAETTYGLLVYGTNAIAVQTRGSFQVMRFADPNDASMVTGLAQADNGELWLSCIKGIVRVSAEEFALAISNPNHLILTNNVAEGDYTGPTQANLFSQSVQKDYQGRIFFSTPNGIVSISPEKFLPTKPPSLTIKSVVVDDAPLPLNRSLKPGVNVLSVKYTGIDFSDPVGLTYAYRLDGYDKTWQLVGPRTEAVYTHLKAGRYRFTVKVRNAYGSWSNPVSLEPFTIRPHFYERGWFLTILALQLIALFWLGVLYRTRIAAGEIQRNAEERADERVTIARDLHDTLLQGVQGLLLSFHAAIEGVPDQHQSRPALERALTSAEKLIIEGRDRVKGLRSAPHTDDHLSQRIQAVADDLGCGDQLQLRISPDATQGPALRESVAAELFLIAREAILNAVRHARASRIVVRLQFRTSTFRLECEDNGIGFDLSKASPPAEPRWGILGMRERVEALDGKLEINTALGKGTVVRVTLPAKNAFR